MDLNYFNSLTKEEFKKELLKYSEEYYNSYEPDEITISDNDFDKLVELYEKKYDKFSTLIPIKNSIKLPKYMHSLNKIKTQKDINLFIKQYDDIFIIMDKIDGVSALYFENKLFTRGDGKEGSDISHLLKYFKLPKISKDIYVRGEIVMKNKNFLKYSKEMANARNMVSGLINSKTEDNRVFDLSFIAYELDNKDNINLLQQLTDLEEMKFELPFYKVLNKISEEILKEMLLNRKKNVEYNIDGLVISKNNKPFREIDKLPKDIIAFKMEGEIAETKVEYIEWNISKNGLLKPRVKLEPIKLCGVTINWATGNNADFIFSNKIGKNSIVEITRSGDVIPKIINVIKSSDKTLEEMLPEICKEEEWKWNETKKDIILTNKGLDSLNKRKIVEFFKELNAKFLGESTIEKIYNKLLENNISPSLNNFFNLDEKFLLSIDTFKKKSVERILNTIKECITDVNIEDIASASGVLGQGIGKKKFKTVLKFYPNIFKLLSLKDEEIEKKIKEIKGFKKMSTQFVLGLRNLDIFLKENSNIKIKKINDNKLNEKNDIIFEDNSEEEKKENNKLKDIKVVFSNVRDKVLEKYIEDNGGEVMNSISKKTNLLIVDNILSTTTKIKKAQELNIKIITIEEFKKEFL